VFGLDLTFKDENEEYITTRVQHYYGTIGLVKFLNSDNTSFLEPSVWIKYTQGAPANVDLNLRYYLPINLWIGAGASTAGTAHLETGVNLSQDYDRTFRVGYGFDYSFSSFGPSAGSTHEINLAFSFYRD